MIEEKRKIRREKLAEFVRERFMEAAWDALAEEGLKGLTMDEVARRAGYATGTLYNYFSSKDELLVRVIQRAAEQTRTYVSAEPPKGLSPQSGVEWLVRQIMDATESQQALLVSVYNYFPSLSAEAHIEVRNWLAAHMLEMIDVIAEQLGKIMESDQVAYRKELAWLLVALVKGELTRSFLAPQAGVSLRMRVPVTVRVFMEATKGLDEAAYLGGR